ncbi:MULTISPECIES: YggS family pyridoxal phosphate-dependent enzyme [Capnocytophaga]|uniref:Pyridoxal phosphate homeostasis protein n=1 Tax=Capnocytophaga canis TaxID=1848903 RepID=A0A3A1YL15_9FLAO|nr:MULTISPECIES: YggS family pyridoxal phosphate-dependent enzyme [Capnocytophaga]ATA73202.1 YggS family pyridoxal phosphate-dependent enzyme [Capnocytophaga sp. H4358]RIY38271.1 YggS family pyridoxal phosphate-dependent enzyme [Capnocytophaga canis]GIM61502.1 YggS family pyridoxal phosphate enzyme [Capnocytophaga canis]
MNQNITENINQIQARIENACQKVGRNPKEVKLLLATKTVNAERIKTALNAGYTLIAENKVQEVKEKYDALKDIPHTSHFIGHLQTNKIKEILRYNIHCIQSLDRIELAQKLQQRLAYENKNMDVFIQVNTSNEASKFGIAPEKAIALVQEVAQFDRLHIKGLMTIGLFSAKSEEVRPCFQLLKNLQLEINGLNITNVDVSELSMGMSNDLEIAIEEGATIIRVGTAIFGKRIYSDSYYWNENH